MAGADAPPSSPKLSGDFATMMKWADKYRTLKRAHQRRHAGATPSGPAKFGAEGIGLCRTEHMFFEGERIQAMREMILAKKDDVEARKRALAKLLPYQRKDFVGIFRR